MSKRECCLTALVAMMLWNCGTEVVCTPQIPGTNGSLSRLFVIILRSLDFGKSLRSNKNILLS